jgi:hypothetical protein
MRTVRMLKIVDTKSGSRASRKQGETERVRGMSNSSLLTSREWTFST